MSRKKSPVTLLGPDGAVLDPAKYRRKREPARTPEPEPQPITAQGIANRYLTEDGGSVIRSFTLSFGDGRVFASHSKPGAKSLGDAVAEQIGALAADFEGTGHAELARPKPDLHTYRDAYASAAANCLHDDAIEMLYDREWVCDACGRTLDRDDMRRARAKRGSFFGGFFG